jgi:WD40 repeat protein
MQFFGRSCFSILILGALTAAAAGCAASTPAVGTSTVTIPAPPSPTDTPTAAFIEPTPTPAQEYGTGQAPTAAPYEIGILTDPLPAGALARLGKGETAHMALSRDEHYLAIAGAVGVHLYRIDDAQGTLTEVWFQATTRRAEFVAFAPDGLSLVVGMYIEDMSPGPCHPRGETGDVILLDRETGGLIRTFEFDTTGWLGKYSVSPDASVLGVITHGGINEWLYILDFDDPEPAPIPINGDSESATAATFSPDGKWLAYGSSTYSPSGDFQAALTVLDLQTREILHRFELSDADIQTIAFSPDGRRLAAGDADGRIRVWETATGGKAAFFLVPKTKQMRFSDDNLRLFLRTDTRIIHWDLAAEGQIWSLVTHSMGMTVSRDGRSLFSYDEDALTVWNAEDGKEIRDYLLSGHGGFYTPKFSPDGKEIITATTYGRVAVWDSLTYQLLRQFDVGDGRFPFAISHENRLLARVVQSSVQIWDYGQGKPVRTLSFPDAGIRHATFAPGGGMLAAASSDTIYLVDSLTGEILMQQPARLYAEFSPDGRLLAFRSADYSRIILWDIGRNAMDGAVDAGSLPEASGLFPVFSPDGSYLAVVGWSFGINWWSVAEKKSLPDPSVYSPWPLVSVAFSPDGRTGAAGSFDVLLWELSTGRQLCSLYGHQCWVDTVAYSPDSRILASGSYDGTVLLWDTTAALGDA